jgi:hypothetical protein
MERPLVEETGFPEGCDFLYLKAVHHVSQPDEGHSLLVPIP